MSQGRTPPSAWPSHVAHILVPIRGHKERQEVFLALHLSNDVRPQHVCSLALFLGRQDPAICTAPPTPLATISQHNTFVVPLTRIRQFPIGYGSVNSDLLNCYFTHVHRKAVVIVVPASWCETHTGAGHCAAGCWLAPCPVALCSTRLNPNSAEGNICF